MNFLDDVPDEVQYEHTNIKILDVNITDMLLIIPKGICGAIDADNNSCHSKGFIA